MESVVQVPASERTGWLRTPEASVWAEALQEIVALSETERRELGERAKIRAKEKFGMEAMAVALEEVVSEAAGMGEVRGELGTVLVMMGLPALVVLLIAAFVARYLGAL